MPTSAATIHRTVFVWLREKVMGRGILLRTYRHSPRRYCGRGETVCVPTGKCGRPATRGVGRAWGLQRTRGSGKEDADDDENHVEEYYARTDTCADQGPLLGAGGSGDGCVVTSGVPFGVDLGRVDDGHDAERQTADSRTAW